MHLARKMYYAIVLAWYYTFSIVYSLRIGYTDVVIASLIITCIAYIWILNTADTVGAFEIFDYKDLVINVFVYSFVSFYVAGMGLVFSGKPIDFAHTFLMISPVTVWAMIWTDYYLQRLKVSSQESR